MASYYETLGVAPDADQDEIARAYRRLAIITHPDQNMGDPAAAERFREIQEAYRVLSDPERRRAYDDGTLEPLPQLAPPEEAPRVAAGAPPDRLRVGAILGATVEVGISVYRPFLAYAAIFLVPLGIASDVAYGAALNGVRAPGVWLALVEVVSVVVGFSLQGSLAPAVRDVQIGLPRPGVRELLRTAGPRFRLLLTPALIYAAAVLAIVLALFLLRIFALPVAVFALWLLVRWSVLAQVVVLEEKEAYVALRRSAELVRGSGWTVFLLLLAAAIALVGCGGMLNLVFSFLPGAYAGPIASTVGQVLMTPFVAVAWSLVYLRLIAREQGGRS